MKHADDCTGLHIGCSDFEYANILCRKVAHFINRTEGIISTYKRILFRGGNKEISSKEFLQDVEWMLMDRVSQV